MAALENNLCVVSSHCPDCKIIPVIKANGYGHGLEPIAKALAESSTDLSAFAVATLDEALQLRSLGFDTSILLLSGFGSEEELELCFQYDIESVLHTQQQLQQLEKQLQQKPSSAARRFWLKFNSGMNRLGLQAPQIIQAYQALSKYAEIELVLMSHLACADDPQNLAASDFTRHQLAQFDELREQLAAISSAPLSASFAASAGILNLPASHYQIVRPGIMLYGSSPFLNRSSEEIGLLPVMTLHSRLIAINEIEAGASIGYGATYTCERDTRVGVLAIGYGDGYPRSAANGTPVLMKTATGAKMTSLIGRVSMDMITIDLTDLDDVQLGDEAVLWGEGLPAEDVAKHAATISYELFCKVTARVSFEYK